MASIAAAALGCAASGPVAAAPLVVGMADQKPEFFADQRFLDLGLRHVRVAVPYDAINNAGSVAGLDRWMNAAREGEFDVLVSFMRSLQPGLRRHVPSPRQYRTAVRAFVARYPWVRSLAPWNEANICNALLCHRPATAAWMYKEARRACPSCRVLGAVVADSDSAPGWLREFLRHVRPAPRIWGVHAYGDVNTGTTRRTREIARIVPGQIWLTEVGGVVKRFGGSRSFPRGFAQFVPGVGNATQATGQIFRLARRIPDVRRVYLYHWSASAGASWDSAFISVNDHERPALPVLRRALARILRSTL